MIILFKIYPFVFRERLNSNRFIDSFLFSTFFKVIISEYKYSFQSIDLFPE